ncbi:MAG: cell division transport system permease protein [Frankiales bacterium]|jgi:cell division transport system permease protein|nr:cell division transport system permease protein [Frankiales bacterium]
MRAQFVASEMLIGVRRNVTMILSVVLAVAVSLFLVGFALLVRDEVDRAKGYWYDKVQVSVFLCGVTVTPKCPTESTQAEKDAVNALLHSLPQVQTVYFETHQQAYQRAQELFKNSPALLQAATPENLPESYRVKLKDPSKTNVIVSAVAGMPGVDNAFDQRQAFAKVFDLMARIQNGAGLVALLIAAAAVLMIVNTTRLAFFGRRREVGIMRLVGASNTYIQLPFMLEGVLAGVIGALVSFVMLLVMRSYLFAPFTKLLSAGVGSRDVVVKLPWLLLSGAILPLVAAWATLRRYMRI